MFIYLFYIMFIVCFKASYYEVWKQLVERPQQILVNYVHISWRAFELLQ